MVCLLPQAGQDLKRKSGKDPNVHSTIRDRLSIGMLEAEQVDSCGTERGRLSMSTPPTTTNDVPEVRNSPIREMGSE